MKNKTTPTQTAQALTSWIKSGSLGVLTVENAPTHSLAVYAGFAPPADALLITTGGSNPFLRADSAAIKQMVSCMLPKLAGDGAAWQERGVAFLSALVDALCYQRDTNGVEVTPSAILQFMPIPKVEELYIVGLKEATLTGVWPYALLGIKAYLETGCPAYRLGMLLAKYPELATGQFRRTPEEGTPAGVARTRTQDSMAFEQHAYRTSQVEPVLRLLQATFSGIDEGPGHSCSCQWVNGFWSPAGWAMQKRCARNLTLGQSGLRHS